MGINYPKVQNELLDLSEILEDVQNSLHKLLVATEHNADVISMYCVASDLADDSKRVAGKFGPCGGNV